MPDCDIYIHLIELHDNIMTVFSSLAITYRDTIISRIMLLHAKTNQKSCETIILCTR